jgi:uncharacterized protein (TIRG00374 family)
MGLYLGAMIWNVRGDLAQALAKFPASVLPSAIGLVLLGLGLRAARWHYYVRRLKWPVPWHHSVAAFLASFAFTATPGKAGEVVKSVLLRTRYDVPLSGGFGVLLVERLGDLLAVLILASGGLTLLDDANNSKVFWCFLVSGLIVGGPTLFVGNRWIYFPVLSRAARIGKLRKLADRLILALDTCRSLLAPVPFLLGLAIALLAWACEGLAFHLVAGAFGIELELLQSFSIYGVATLVGALSALPGGIGSFEFIMGLLLTTHGVTVKEATMPIIVFRLCTLWLGSLVGLAFMFGWLWLVGPGETTIQASAKGSR